MRDRDFKWVKIRVFLQRKKGNITMVSGNFEIGGFSLSSLMFMGESAVDGLFRSIHTLLVYNATSDRLHRLRRLISLSIISSGTHRAASFSPSPARSTSTSTSIANEPARPPAYMYYAVRLDLSILDPIIQHPATKGIKRRYASQKLERTHEHFI
jgi:hypothetical protein